jgi:transcriptional regulator with XRE-family HTH domain
MIILKNLPSLADRLKYIRKVMGLSQQDLAEIGQTTQQAIQQAESGKARSPRYLHRIAHDLAIPYEWLTMNLMPGEAKQTAAEKGFAEKGQMVLDSFFSMPKKDQELLLELMKSRRDKNK